MNARIERIKQTILAAVLILVGIYLIISKSGIIPEYIFITAVLTVGFSYAAVSGILNLHFTIGFLSLGILACLHDKVLGIDAVPPIVWVVAGGVLGIVLDLLFKEIKRKRRNEEFIRVENSFGSVSRYVNSESLRGAYIENSFGECNVYFEDAIPADGNATIRARTSFGKTSLYLPKEWHVECSKDCPLGGVFFHGEGSKDAKAPFVELQLTCNFGQIDVFFE